MQLAEGGFLFGSHLGFGCGGLIRLTREMQQAVDNNTMQLVEKWHTLLLGIGGNRVQRNINIAIHARVRGIIKGDDIGIVVVLKELTIDRQNLLVVAEDIVELAYRIAILRCSTLDPLLDFRKVNGRHGDVVRSEGNHICV